jgi:hypothetical protein
MKYFLIFTVPNPDPENFLMQAKIDPNRPDPAGELDCAWVIRWLDDIGLPQYKVTTRFLICMIFLHHSIPHPLGSTPNPLVFRALKVQSWYTRAAYSSAVLQDFHFLYILASMLYCIVSVICYSPHGSWQCCGSGSGMDPNSMESLDPYPDSHSGPGYRREKITHKHRKKFINLIF